MLEFDLKKSLNFASGDGTLDVSGQVDNGETIALYGPSGAGKSTLLNLLSGLKTPDEGTIRFENNLWHDKSRQLIKPGGRKIGMVYQSYTLFPNMSIFKNLEYALEKGQNPAIIHELVEMVQLKQLLNKKVTQLSGGQKQRVALARALVRKPNLLLLDEPFTALDQKMRIQLQKDLKSIQERYQTTTVMVSHDLPEIFRLADKVWEMSEGKILAKGKPTEVFKKTHNHEKSVIGEIVEIQSLSNENHLTIWTGGQLLDRKVPRDGTFAKGMKVRLLDEGVEIFEK